MKLIKQINESSNVRQATTIAYHNVAFTTGFMRFIECLDRTCPQTKTSSAVTETTKGWVWKDSLADGGVRIETDVNPLLLRNQTPTTMLVTACSTALHRTVETAMRDHCLVGGITEQLQRDDPVYQYHDALPSVLWNGKRLRLPVEQKLLQITDEFEAFLDMKDLEVVDVILTGSTANYNWTTASDVDLHLVVDMDSVVEQYGTLAEQYFSAKKQLWNDKHDIKIGPHDVELYVQDQAEEHHSTGVYSIIRKKWLVSPTHNQPDVDDSAVRSKVNDLIAQINNVTDGCSKAAAVEQLLKKIIKMRQAGLEKEGEFSVENLAFKLLRAHGYLDQLSRCKDAAYDRALSIEEEEWNVIS